MDGLRDWGGDFVVEPRNQAAWIAENWNALIVGPDLFCVARGEPHPVNCGVYFLFDADGALLYIGGSHNIGTRMAQHYWADRVFASYGATSLPPGVVEAVEAAYIDALNPPENRLRSVACRCDAHKKLVKAIREAWASSLRPAGSPVPQPADVMPHKEW